MTRNWNKVRARLTDPFDPDNEEVDQQIQATIAKQDAQGGHMYPEFHLTDSHPSKSSGPAGDDSHLFERPIPTRAKSTETTSSTRKVADTLEVPPSQPRKSAKTPNDPDPRAYILDSALTASKRAAFRKRKEWARQRDTPASYTDTNVSKLDLPLRGSKRKADDANHDEEHGREAKRRTAPDGRPTASPFKFEDYLDY